MRLKLSGVDFMAISKMERDRIIIAFQTGVEYWQRKIEEANEAVDKIEAANNEEEIPF